MNFWELEWQDIIVAIVVIVHVVIYVVGLRGAPEDSSTGLLSHPSA